MYYIELAGTCVSELTVMNEVTINHQNSTVVLSSKYRAKTLYDSIHSTFSLPPENASKTLEGQRLIICGDHIYRRLVHWDATPT